jgi:hypothetical protein
VDPDPALNVVLHLAHRLTVQCHMQHDKLEDPLSQCFKSGSEGAKKVSKERIKTKKFNFSKNSLKGWKFLLEQGRFFNDVIHMVNCH